MKYRFNKLPVKTTNGFQINDVEVELDVSSYCRTKDVFIQGDVSSLTIQQEMKKETLTTKLGLEVSEYEEIRIQVPKGVSIKEPICITYELEEKDWSVSKISIQYEEDSSCDFIIMNTSHGSCFQYLIEGVSSKKNSSGNISIMNMMDSNSQLFYALENDVLENANITHTIVDLGGKTRLYNAYSNLLEEKAKNTLNTIYVGKDDSLLDFHYYLNNIGVETNNQMKVEGVLTDSSHKNFRGTLDFQKGCSRSVGEENENCILLTDTCRSRSLPQMLCGEEDVVGAHGVSSGKVEEEKMFYLMSRGLNQKEAEKLIVLGRFKTILDLIPSDEKRARVLSLIEEKLS